eukprot:gene5438-7531_t
MQLVCSGNQSNYYSKLIFTVALIIVGLIAYIVNFQWILTVSPNVSHNISSDNTSKLRFNDKKNKKDSICLVTRLRNVPSFIPAWIEWHKIIGVDNFFIIDDCSNSLEQKYWADFYQKQKVLKYYDAIPRYNCTNPHFPMEAKLTRFGVNQAVKSNCKWIGVIDVDEYLSPLLHENVTLLQALQSSTSGVLQLRWLLMGHSNHINQLNTSKPSTFKCGYWYDQHPIIKTIAKSSIIEFWENSHYPWYKTHTIASNLYQGSDLFTQELINISNNCKISKSGFYIRHYKYTSFEEHMKTRANRTFQSDGRVEPSVSANSKYDDWKKFNFPCTTCSTIGEQYVLEVDRKVNEQIKSKYSIYSNDPHTHIYRGIPFQSLRK